MSEIIAQPPRGGVGGTMEGERGPGPGPPRRRGERTSHAPPPLPDRTVRRHRWPERSGAVSLPEAEPGGRPDAEHRRAAVAGPVALLLHRRRQALAPHVRGPPRPHLQPLNGLVYGRPALAGSAAVR